jgi:DNA-binding transcriptional LysR family regulator
MPDVHLRNVDLNLLHALHALLEERHVTRAAKRSFLSQPAMSRALDRLRETFGDPLLVRTGRVYERTVRGESVLRELESTRLEKQPTDLRRRHHYMRDGALVSLAAYREAV